MKACNDGEFVGLSSAAGGLRASEEHCKLSRVMSGLKLPLYRPLPDGTCRAYVGRRRLGGVKDLRVRGCLHAAPRAREEKEVKWITERHWVAGIEQYLGKSSEVMLSI